MVDGKKGTKVVFSAWHQRKLPKNKLIYLNWLSYSAGDSKSPAE
jgi:hypothetical protein